MSNPDKHWSLGRAIGRGTGGAIGAGAAGAVIGTLGGPVGVPVAAGIGAAGGFVGGFLGAVLGHWLDDPIKYAESPGSAALYTTVVCGFVAMLFHAITLEHIFARPEIAMWGLFGIGALSGFLSSISRNLIDDFRASIYRSRVRDNS